MEQMGEESDGIIAQDTVHWVIERVSWLHDKKL